MTQKELMKANGINDRIKNYKNINYSLLHKNYIEMAISKEYDEELVNIILQYIENKIKKLEKEFENI